MNPADFRNHPAFIAFRASPDATTPTQADDHKEDVKQVSEDQKYSKGVTDGTTQQ